MMYCVTWQWDRSELRHVTHRTILGAQRIQAQVECVRRRLLIAPTVAQHEEDALAPHEHSKLDGCCYP